MNSNNRAEVRRILSVLAFFLLCSSCRIVNGSTVLPELDCLIEPEIVVDVSSPVDGTMEEMFVEKTQRVIQGQVLIKLESSVQEATLELMRQQAQSTEDIQLKEVALKFAERKLKRYEELYARKAVSSFERDQAETEVELAKLELTKAKSNREKQQLEFKRAQTAVALRVVRSPINGVLVEQFLMPGESVSKQPIMRIAQIDPLRVEVIVPDEFFGEVIPGMEAQIHAENSQAETFSATVTYVDKTIEAASGSFAVTLALPNPDYLIPSGLRCRVQFLDAMNVTKSISH